MKEQEKIYSVINASEIFKDLIRLPDEKLSSRVYKGVKKLLEGIGGRWDRKKGGFYFEYGVSKIDLDTIKDGGHIDLKKKYQFFETSAKVSDKVIELADIKQEDYILEPSAGAGSLVNAINRSCNIKTSIDVCEIQTRFHKILSSIDNVAIIGDDFLKTKFYNLKYDKIVANPPFSKNQDIAHIYKMYELLAEQGRLVSIASIHWKENKNKKETAFRQWLKDKKAIIIDLEVGSFKEAKTNVATCIIVINK